MLCENGHSSNAWGKRCSDASAFQSRHGTCLTETKVKLAWLPPRHRNITIPFNCLWFGNYCIRLTYTASVHVQLPQRIGCWCQTPFEAIGKVYQVNQVEISSFGNMCNSIELNDHRSAFIQSAKPSGRHKIMAWDVKHLPRFKFYRPIIVGALEVWLAVDLAVLLGNHNWCTRYLSWRLRCRGWSRGSLGRITSRWCCVRHRRCRWRWLHWLRRMLSISPKDQQSNLGQSSPDSNSSFAIGPALPSGLSKIHMNPTVALGSIHCDIQRICGHTDRTSSTQWPAERLVVVADHNPCPCPWLASGSGQSDAGIPLALRQYPSWRTLPMETQPHLMRWLHPRRSALHPWCYCIVPSTASSRSRRGQRNNLGLKPDPQVTLSQTNQITSAWVPPSLSASPQQEQQIVGV